MRIPDEGKSGKAIRTRKQIHVQKGVFICSLKLEFIETEKVIVQTVINLYPFVNL